MKTLRYLSNAAFVFSLAMLASCSSDNDFEPKQEGNESTPTGANKLVFSATIDDSNLTRTTLSGTNTLWEKGDKLAVFCDNQKNSDYQTVTIDEKDAGKNVATFSSDFIPSTFVPSQYYRAFYPTTGVSSYSNSDQCIYSTLKTNQTLTVENANTLPYDKSAMMMIACADKDKKALTFRNVPALIKVTISNNTGTNRVKYIKFISNSTDTELSGDFKAYLADDEAISATVTATANNKNYAIIEVPEVADNVSKDFYLAVLPATSANGFTLLLESEFNTTTKSQYIYQRVSSSETTLESGKIYKMGSYNVGSDQTAGKFLTNVVDLDLPSGTIWATRNAEAGSGTTTKFATNWYDNGGYYSWGEITAYGQNKDWGDGQPKTSYSPRYYKWCDDYNNVTGSLNTLSKYNNSSSYTSSFWGYGTIDNKTTLETIDDAAYQIEGNAYCMPTYEQIYELYDVVNNNSSFEVGDYLFRSSNNKKQFDGHNGVMITNTSTNRYLWFPAAGTYFYEVTGTHFKEENEETHYWSRSLNASDPLYAYCFDLRINNGNLIIDNHGISSGTGSDWNDRRPTGKSIRPVVVNKAIAPLVTP